MTIADFKELAAAIQSVAIAVATLFGGCWALFRFFSLRDIKRAQLDLDRAERDLTERGVVEVSLDPKHFQTSQGHFIALGVTLKNTGSGAEAILGESFRATASEVDAILNDQPQLSERAAAGRLGKVPGSIVLAPGESYRSSFLIHVRGPAIYYLFFAVECSPRVMGMHNVDAKQIKRSDATTGWTTWASDSFFQIPEEPPNQAPAPVGRP
jgi:hypothetical protein